MRTFSPVFSSSSVWNFSMGWDWFSANHKAFRLRLVRAKGKCCSLEKQQSRSDSSGLKEISPGCLPPCCAGQV